MSDYYFPNNRAIRDFEDYVNKYYDELQEAFLNVESRMQFIDFCNEKWAEYLKKNDELRYGL